MFFLLWTALNICRRAGSSSVPLRINAICLTCRGVTSRALCDSSLGSIWETSSVRRIIWTFPRAVGCPLAGDGPLASITQSRIVYLTQVPWLITGRVGNKGSSERYARRCAGQHDFVLGEMSCRKVVDSKGVRQGRSRGGCQNIICFSTTPPTLLVDHRPMKRTVRESQQFGRLIGKNLRQQRTQLPQGSIPRRLN